MTTAIHSIEESTTEAHNVAQPDHTTEPTAEPAPRPPALADLLAQAEAAQPDTIATAQADLSEIIGRADWPQPGDGQRLLELASKLQIDRKTVRAAVEAIAGWNRQRDKAQGEAAKAELRQAELAGKIADLEAKRLALELPDGYAALHALATGGLAHMLQKRAPNLQGGFLNYCGATSDQFGFSKEGSYRSFPMQSATRREWVNLLRGDVAKGIIADLTRRNVARGGVASGCSIEQLVEADL
jgi:hypothetical protein